MVAFWVYDVTFLILFTLGVIWFIKTRKHNLGREGIIFMYRTKLGIKAINYIGDNYKKTLHALKYPIIALGFVLMAGMLWMLGKTLSLYMFNPEITKIIKAPPIAPLIPYFPKLFGMSSFFPPFYFTYFIIALAIVAVVHEFSHGIFMRLFKVKIKSTGLVFLGPILGAFVEEEKKGFVKKKKVEQMTILGAGVFANTVFALIFYGLYVGFFLLTFVPSGYVYSSYAMGAIDANSITSFSNESNLLALHTVSGTYYLDKNLGIQLNSLQNISQIVVYADAPAVKAGMKGVLIGGDDFDIRRHSDLKTFLAMKSPGDNVTMTTLTDEGEQTYAITLGKNPSNPSVAYLGIGHNQPQTKGFISKMLMSFMSFKDSSTYYVPKWNADIVYFFVHLLWWIMVINLLVALFNMLPLGILDGGRFFYLTMLGISRSEKFAARAFKVATYLIILSFILMMIYWVFGISFR